MRQTRFQTVRNCYRWDLSYLGKLFTDERGAVGRVPVKESEVQKVVEDGLTVFGYLWAHHPDSRKMHGTPGLPDLTCVHPNNGTVVFIECKGSLGEMAWNQHDWAKAVDAGAAVWMLATPHTLDNVIDELRSISHSKVTVRNDMDLLDDMIDYGKDSSDE